MFRFALLGLLFAAPAVAETTRITEESVFVAAVSGKSLTSLGVRLVVTPDGAISGRAFGRNVTGAWQWQSGMFCREMTAGSQVFARNCQVVQRDGNSMTFVADEGRGDTARLTLR